MAEAADKKSRRDAQLERVVAEQAVAQRTRRKAARAALAQRTQQYEEEYAAEEREAVERRRTAKAEGSFYVPPEPKLAFVVRIRGINGVAPKTKKILRLLRLLQINNGVFVALNDATIPMLRYVSPYIAFGTPSLKTVRELIYKRGHGKMNGQRLPLSDNSVIEAVLGRRGILGIEDLIHEIYTVGPNFSACANFCWPFKLSSPRGGFGARGKLTHHNEGGASGNRGDGINAFIKQMI